MNAVMLTFITSALMHEAIMAIAFRFVRGWFFVGMAIQAPFVIIGPYMKHSKRTGNILMWCSLFAGQPLLILLYFRVCRCPAFLPAAFPIRSIFFYL